MKKKQQEQEETNPIHIRMDKPLSFRKEVLSCALGTAQLIQAYSELEQVRQKKADTIKKLKQTIDSIKKLEKDFEKSLPKVEYQQKQIVQPITQDQPKQVIEQKPTPKKQDTEVEKIQKELADIERKLAEL